VSPEGSAGARKKEATAALDLASAVRAQSRPLLRSHEMRTAIRAARSLLALASLLMIACGGEKTASPPASSTGNAPTAAPTKVTTASVAVSQQPLTIRATGSFTAAESSQVSPKVAGQIIATPVDSRRIPIRHLSPDRVQPDRPAVSP